MGNKGNIPEAINKFNIYKNGNVLIGVSAEVQLPEITSMTETISGVGLLGEIETSIVGMFNSMEQEIPFRMLDDDIFSMANPLEVQELTLRASEQSTVKSTGGIAFTNMRVVFRGRPKSFKPGTIKQGAQMGASLTLELVYILIEIDGKRKLELDKLNDVYKLNDVDVISKIKGYC